MIKTLQGIGRNKHSPLEKVPFFPNGTPFKVTHLVSKWIHLSLLHHSWSECHKHCPLGSQKPWDLPGLQCASPFRLQEADPSVLHQSCSLALWLQIEVQAVGGTAACGEQRRVMRSGVESLGSLFHGYRWQWLSSWLPGPELLLGSCCCCCCVASVMSDSMRPHRRQPTGLPHPWDSPGKNTGVGCQFLLQCMKVKSQSEVAQSCPTLSDPMDCSLPGSSVHGIFQARVLEWGAIAQTY